MQYCNFLVRVDFLPILISESPDDGCYSVPAQMWLYSLPCTFPPSLLDHGWPHDQPKWLGSHQRLRSLAFLVLVLVLPILLLLLLSLLWLCLCFQCWHPLLQKLPFYAKALIANCKTVWRVFALVMSQCAYLNGSVFFVKTRYFLHENCAKSRELCVVFWKKCVLELQFECKAGTVLVI